jgi:type IX secretion system substrate protein
MIKAYICPHIKPLTKNMKKHKLPGVLMNIIFVLFTSLALAQAPFQWYNTHLRPGTINGGLYPKEANYDVKYLSSGNAIGVGSAHPTANFPANDLAFRKYRGTDGMVIAEVYIDYYTANEDDKAVKIVVSEPYIYVLATCRFGTTTFDNDIILFKMDTSFNIAWQRSFNGTGNVNDEAIDMGMDAAGNIYIIGNTSRTATGNDLVWLKYAPDGTNLFTKYYTSSGNNSDKAKAMVVEPSGVCDITGFYGSATNGQRLAALKLWGNGVLLWVRYHDVVTATTNLDEGKAISFDPATSDVYVTGRGQNTAGDYDWLVIKFEGADGTKLWYKKFMSSGTTNDEGVGISFTALGELFSCGNMATTVSSVSSANILLKKLNPADGTTIFTRTYNFLNGTNGPSQDYARNMISTPPGNVYVMGTILFPTPTYGEASQVVLCYNPAGTLLWSHKQAAGTSSGFQGSEAVCASFSNSSGTLFVGGWLNTSMSFVGQATMMKFSPAAFAEPGIASREVAEETEINIYPNPAEDFLVISQNDSRQAYVEIYDMNGRCLLKTEFDNEEKRIDLSMLESGAYFVRFRNSDHSKTFEVIKK